MNEVSKGARAARVSLKWAIYLIVGLLLLGWLLNTPEGILGKADAIGYSVCHRIDGRSFHIGERQMPLCVRCTGQYLGAMIGLVFLSVVDKRKSGFPPKRVLVILGIFSLLYVIDGINSYLHLPFLMEAFPNLPRLYEPQHFLRLLTGSGLGVAIIALLFPVFNATVWRKWDGRRILGQLRWLFLLLMLVLFVDILALTENSAVLYILALISAGGVLILLTMVYTIVWVLLLQKVNQFERISQMAFPLALGFGTSLLQIALIDYARFALTGTWSGFIIG